MSQTARGLRTVALLLLLLLIGNIGLAYITSQTLRMITDTAIATDEALQRLQFTLDSITYMDEYYDDYEPSVFFYEAIPLPYEIQQHLFDTCTAFDVDLALILAVIEVESNFDTDASGDGGKSAGLMQLNQANWASLRESGMDPFDVYDNIRAGILMIRDYLIDYGDVHQALMAYNGGKGYARSLQELGINTTGYSTKVVEAAEKWERTLSNVEFSTHDMQRDVYKR